MKFLHEEIVCNIWGVHLGLLRKTGQYLIGKFKNISMFKKNTCKEGTLIFILYPTEENTFVAACQELCLVREGKDPETVKYQILGDAKRYIANVCKNKLGEHLLNQKLPKEIIAEFNEYRKKIKNNDFEQWKVDIHKIKRSNPCSIC